MSSGKQTLSLSVLQGNDKSAFLEAIDSLFEAAPVLSEKLWDARPYTSFDDMINKASEIIKSLSIEDRILVLNTAHPRIGADPNKVKLSAASYKEQGLDKEAQIEKDSPAEVEMKRINALLSKLNDEYEAKFGFIFVIFVNGRPKSEIVKVLQTRINNDRETELNTGLAAMTAIAASRLQTKKITT
eukprot:TRINITY_DN2107_c0_g1_i1.p1 TRINITY_DN2107_c0_g1~~TRINITY_DN2107_c0_g1_i1.p1  ORF type:complete len:186 (+),score=40.27 TRINITY_DN2107_c0_g1_i1:30-587(+)